jgi:hypothetical protein
MKDEEGERHGRVLRCMWLRGPKRNGAPGRRKGGRQGRGAGSGREDVFWAETDGKWKRRSAPKRPLDELVKERTSPAVKAALKSLLEAPAFQAARKNEGRYLTQHDFA